MAGTRSSTRRSAAETPKYTESSDDDTAAASNGKKPTPRGKRAREQDDEGKQPAKRSKAKPSGRAESNATSALSTLKEPERTKTGKTMPELAREKVSKARSSHARARSTTQPSGPSEESGLRVMTPNNRDASGAQQVFWLFKAEPLPRLHNGVNVSFSIDDLAKCTEPEPWSGVRNPQARNTMQAMKVGDLGFFYHSNAKPSGVVGVLRVVKEAEVDETAFDRNDPYFDEKSDRKVPKWYCVSVEFVRKFDEVVDLASIKSTKALEDMQLITHSRLSVARLRPHEWDTILSMAGETENKSKKT